MVEETSILSHTVLNHASCMQVHRPLLAQLVDVWLGIHMNIIIVATTDHCSNVHK